MLSEFLHMDNPKGFQAMHEACSWSSHVDEDAKMKVISVLLSHEANPECQVNDGSTALMLASRDHF